MDLTAFMESITNPLGMTNKQEGVDMRKVITDEELEVNAKAHLEHALDFFELEWDGPGVEANIGSWMKFKLPVVNMLRNHPNWNEESLSVVLTIEESRDLDKEKAYDLFVHHLLPMIEGLSVDEFVKFRRSVLYSDFYRSNAAPDHLIECVNDHYDLKANGGMKTARLLRKLWKTIGVDVDSKDFVSVFSKYADALSPYKVKKPFVLSVNPGDYITMSYGNTWSSCHIANPNFAKGGGTFNACYRLGTVSYMNDGPSMVGYTVKEIPENISELPKQEKLSRQMFHVDTTNGVLLQARLYPLGCEVPEFAQYRAIVQDIIAKCRNIPNMWTVKKGADEATKLGFMRNDSGHYPDYEYDVSPVSGNANGINVSIPHDTVLLGLSEHRVNIGEKTFCLNCGNRSYDSKSLYCGNRFCDGRICGGGALTCYECGGEIDDGDEFVYDDRVYCIDCVTQCEDCGEYVPNDSTTDVGGSHVYRYVCDSCRDNYTQCEHCGDYVNTQDDDAYVEIAYEVYCRSCAEDHFTYCSHCDEWVANDDFGEEYCKECEEAMHEEEEVEEKEGASQETA